jgi:putative membrane protein
MTFMSYLASHWTAAWPALVGYAVVVGVHLTGLLRLTAVIRPPQGGQVDARAANLGREALAFHVGLLAVLLAVVTPVGYWSGVYIWVRSIQDLLLAVVAPSLIVLGAPWRPLSEGMRMLRRSARRPASSGGPSARGRPAAGWWLAWPTGATAPFSVIWLGWHLPVLYDAGATNVAVRYAGYACYLCIGVLFWLQLIGSRPSGPAAPPLRRLALLIGVVVADTVLGMVLVFGSGVIYPAYRGAAHHALSVVSDQQIGGAVLWMGVLPTFIIAAIALLNTWLDNEERDDPSHDLERLTRRQTVGWPSRSGAGAAAWQTRPRYHRPPTA